MSYTEDDIERRANRIGSLSARQQDLQRKFQNPIPVDRIRWQLTLIVVIAFLLFLAALALYVFIFGDMPRATFIFDVLKTLLLPIVTLMIGHYFGSRSST